MDMGINHARDNVVAFAVNRIAGRRQLGVCRNRHHFALINRQAGVYNPVVPDYFTIGNYGID
jgi:hypothetical protein